MERRAEELEIAEKSIVEARFEDWNRKIKEEKHGEVTAERRKIYVENCEKTIRDKVRSEYEETSWEDKKRSKKSRRITLGEARLGQEEKNKQNVERSRQTDEAYMLKIMKRLLETRLEANVKKKAEKRRKEE